MRPASEVPPSKIEELAALIDTMPSRSRAGGNVVRYDSAKGAVVGRGLLKIRQDPDNGGFGSVAINNTVLSPGAKTRPQAHKEKEWLICYEGNATVFAYNESLVFVPGAMVEIEPGIEHQVCADETGPCRYIVITIPAAETMPDAP